jgi:hypothetical protein
MFDPLPLIKQLEAEGTVSKQLYLDEGIRARDGVDRPCPGGVSS